MLNGGGDYRAKIRPAPEEGSHTIFHDNNSRDAAQDSNQLPTTHAIIDTRGSRQQERYLSEQTSRYAASGVERRRPHSGREEDQLLQAAEPHLQALIIAALETCGRQGELLNLRWGDVSLARGEIVLRAENTKDRENRIFQSQTGSATCWK